MRPPYYLFYYRDHDAAAGSYEAPNGKFVLLTCSIVLAGIVAVAFFGGL